MFQAHETRKRYNNCAFQTNSRFAAQHAAETNSLPATIILAA